MIGALLLRCINLFHKCVLDSHLISNKHEWSDLKKNHFIQVSMSLAQSTNWGHLPDRIGI